MFKTEIDDKISAVEKTIEIPLLAVLIVVAMLSVCLFGDNLQEIAENFSAQNLFNNKGSVNLVSNKNVNHYIKQSQVVINKYKRTIAKSDKQKEELAKATTIAKITGKLSPSDENFVLLTYGINVNTLTNTTYINNDKKLSFNERELYLKKDKNKISAINEVLTGKFS